MAEYNATDHQTTAAVLAALDDLHEQHGVSFNGTLWLDTCSSTQWALSVGFSDDKHHYTYELS